LVRLRVLHFVFALLCLEMAAPLEAQTLNTTDFQIEWKVTNRFRLFNDADFFKLHENAWRQYLIHVKEQQIPEEQKTLLINSASVLGSEHVLNDRYIAFSRLERSKFDWRGWAAQGESRLCWNPKSHLHDLCGDVDGYVNPKAHEIEISLRPLKKNALITEYNCEWRVGNAPVQTAPCDGAVTALLPYPNGADISVAVVGEQPITLKAKVRDLLIVGMGDSFASGEGNPDVPAEFSESQRYKNLYPRRKSNDASGSAIWTDELCHRSLYGHQLRAALQIAIENPQSAVTFLGYACSGAGIEAGILGPQEYVESVSTTSAASSDATTAPSTRFLSGDSKDAQIRWLLRELCAVKPKEDDGLWVCPDNQFRRPVDYLFLSVGGNDIGFRNVVAWATLRSGTSATLAKFLGATVSAKDFSKNMKDTLPGAYARLAKAIERAVPLYSDEPLFDASRVILTAYPDMLVDETGEVCPAGGKEDEEEDRYPANQSLDAFSSWLATTSGRLNAVHEQLAELDRRMKDLSGDHGWTYAGRVYNDRVFRGHGFCAQRTKFANDPAEVLMIPCWGKADRPTQTCQSSWSGKAREWRPYSPITQNYPYALRQRWVRTFNDAYMIVNQKVMDKAGKVDEKASSQIFSETTGAMHPNAEGQAAMADAILMDIREEISKMLGGELY
jgi:lysophospholipase L1-like esterase